MIEHCPKCGEGRLKTVPRNIDGYVVEIVFCEFCGTEISRKNKR